jgi:predicted pyridoxine 5'-phosphate oxidase superfamily flavin-nucleotide-binding protein
MHRITTLEDLDALYGTPGPVAIAKEIDYICDHYKAFIAKAPFVVVATAGPEGLDCSPRGDPPGFVRVRDSKTVLIPDRRGNNRVDGLRNIVRDPRIALLFMIPGIDNTLRINGRGGDHDRAGAVRQLCRARQTAQERAGGNGRARLFPMPQGPGALALVERRGADCALRAAECRRDLGGNQSGQHRRRRL